MTKKNEKMEIDIYTEEELRNIAELIEILESIRARLISEGRNIDEIIQKHRNCLNQDCPIPEA